MCGSREFEGVGHMTVLEHVQWVEAPVERVGREHVADEVNALSDARERVVRRLPALRESLTQAENRVALLAEIGPQRVRGPGEQDLGADVVLRRRQREYTQLLEDLIGEVDDCRAALVNAEGRVASFGRRIVVLVAGLR